MSLIQVQRQNNHKRRYAHVAPFLGKLGPVDHTRLESTLAQAAGSLPLEPGPTLVVGLAEASLILAWHLALHLSPMPDLCFTTREKSRHSRGLLFQEPHSHGPVHWVYIPPERRYEQIVIVEDEVTTGTTILNLVLSLRSYASRFHIVALMDMRSQAHHAMMSEVAASHGLDIQMNVIYGNSAHTLPPMPHNNHIEECAAHWVCLNPHHRSKPAQAAAFGALTRLWQTEQLGVIYMIGECVDVPMAFCSSLPLAHRPPVQHITLSPWVVDGEGIQTRNDFVNGTGSPYYLYNWVQPTPPHAAVVGESSTRAVSGLVSAFLQAHDVETTCIEVAL